MVADRDSQRIGLYFGPDAPPVALRRDGEDFRTLGVLYRPLVADGVPVPARPREMEYVWDQLVREGYESPRISETPLIVVNHELWVRTGEPVYIVGVNHSDRSVVAYSEVLNTPYGSESDQTFLADEHSSVLSALTHWDSRGYEVIHGDELPETQITGAMRPGQTVTRVGLRGMQTPDRVADQQIVAGVQEVALRLRLALAVPTDSSAPLVDYDEERLDPMQLGLVREWVAAALGRDLELSAFDGNPGRQVRRY